MKYSIRGNMNITDGEPIINLLNDYTLWKMSAREEGESFIFEAWINTEAEKNSLFDALKPYVDQYGEQITWHMCTHDEVISQQCHIIETYAGGVI